MLMNRAAATILILLLPVFALAQSFTVEKTSASVTSSPFVLEFYTTIKVYNTGAENLPLKWVRTQELMPANWRTQICTEFYCFPMSTDSAMVTILPGDSDLIQVHFYPFDNYGSSTVVVKVFPASNPSDFVNLTFYGDAVAGVGVEETEKNSVSVYPNPVSGVLNVKLGELSKEARISILNSVGQEVKHLTLTGAQGSASIDVTGLPAGCYFVNVSDAQGNVVRKKFVKE